MTDVAASVAEKGSDTLFAAIQALPPGIQITFIVLIATNVATASGAFVLVRHLLKSLAYERTMSREDGIATRDVLEQNNIALALIKDRLVRP